MLPNQSTCTPMLVEEIFRSLLAKNASATPTAVPQQTTLAPLLTSPPPKHSIRLIENDPTGRREKYDGCRWRAVCQWEQYLCTNLSYTRGLCTKHALQQSNKTRPTKIKRLVPHNSLPILSQRNRISMNADEDDDIQVLEEHCKNPTLRRSTINNVKAELADYSVFSVEPLDVCHSNQTIKTELKTPSHRSSYSTGEVEYVASKRYANGLDITELMAKHIPPLTDFEEEYLASRLIAELPYNCVMLDAQLHLHKEAISVVQKNYRMKMIAVAPEYFYDFLLRHPRVAIHFRQWFRACKPLPPTTGCPIDTKVWSLGMIVRGATSSDSMIDECEG